MTCPFCEQEGGELLWREDAARVVLPDEPLWPGFGRVIAARHVTELSAMEPSERRRAFELVCALEAVLRRMLRPVKMNVASLGNVVPHVHWHVIPRFLDDACYPDPIWAPPRRSAAPRPLPEGFAEQLRAELRAELVA